MDPKVKEAVDKRYKDHPLYEHIVDYFERRELVNGEWVIKQEQPTEIKI